MQQKLNNILLVFTTLILSFTAAAAEPPQYEFIDLGADIEVSAINNPGQIVGNNTNGQAVLLNNIDDQYTLEIVGDGTAAKINDLGQIISDTNILWTKSNNAYDVIELNGTIQDINNKGQVLLNNSIWQNGQYKSTTWTTYIGPGPPYPYIPELEFIIGFNGNHKFNDQGMLIGFVDDGVESYSPESSVYRYIAFPNSDPNATYEQSTWYEKFIYDTSFGLRSISPSYKDINNGNIILLDNAIATFDEAENDLVEVALLDSFYIVDSEPDTISIFDPNFTPQDGTNFNTEAINNNNTIVGQSYLLVDGVVGPANYGNGRERQIYYNKSDFVATVWLDFKAFNLNVLSDADKNGFMLTDAIDINDNGAIIGTATNINTGEAHAYLLKPIDDNQAPTIKLNDPITFDGNTRGSITADVSDTDGTITKVDFYVNDTLVISLTEAPYTASWDGGILDGTYTLLAKAYDDDGAESTSNSVMVEVTNLANTPPTIQLNPPTTNGASNISGSITAIASDADGSIDRVDFYVNDSIAGTVYEAPYTFEWNDAPDGTYTVTTKAYDDNNASTTSEAVLVTIDSSL